MLTLCPKCGKHHEFVRSDSQTEILCSCGERILLKPWSSYRQILSSHKDDHCPYCNRKYILDTIRDNSQITCSCGNILTISNPDNPDKGRGLRKSDQDKKLLEKELLGLIDTSRLLHSSIQNLDNLMSMTVEITTEMLNVEGCSVVLRDKEKKELTLYAIIDEKSSKLASFKIIDDSDFMTKTIQNKETVVVNNVGKDNSDNMTDLSAFKTRSMLCVPLLVNDECVGELELINKKSEDGFTQHDALLAETVAAQIAVAIHNVQMAEKTLKAERRAAMGHAVWEIAHCIKNMMNGLQGGLYVVKSDIKRSDANISDTGFKMLERNIARLKDLVQDMLSAAVDRKPQLEPTDLKDLVKSVVDLLEPNARETGVKFKVENGRNLDNVMLDPKGIYRCILNLVSNALDASKENKGSTISITTDGNSPDWVVITITDQGCGMTKEIKNSIFKTFYSTKRNEGTGLGLSVTQKIINEHGGTIEVVSEPEKGASFIIILPRNGEKAQ